MKEVILEKINLELSNGINTESKALYLLAEVRKYIDRCSKEEKNEYSNLYFYCNWVLHIKMDRTPAKKILNRFESLFSSTNNLKEMSDIFKKQEKDFYSFIELRKELRDFFKINDLPTELLENNNSWFRFKKLLIKILMDCPLVNEKGKVSKFLYEREEDGQIRFRVRIKKLGSFKITLREKMKNLIS